MVADTGTQSSGRQPMRESGPPSGSPQASEVPGQQGGPREEIEHPAKLLRIAAIVKAMLDEVRTVELDEAARARLATIHNRMIEELGDLVSDDLRAELSELELEPVEGEPTGAELRVVQAQLSGWLQGLFHGIQASVASQQLAARQQLAQMKQGQLGPGGEQTGAGAGQYL